MGYTLCAGNTSPHVSLLVDLRTANDFFLFPLEHWFQTFYKRGTLATFLVCEGALVCCREFWD